MLGKGEISNLCVTLEGLLGPANAFLTCFSVNENMVSIDCFLARFFFSLCLKWESCEGKTGCSARIQHRSSRDLGSLAYG